MRRRRRSDSDDDNYRSKRDKLETDTVESLIYRIGSKDLTNIEREVTELASLILLELPRNTDNIVRILAKCVRLIPERMIIYATMIGLLNLKNRGFVNQLIETLQRNLKDAVKSACFEDARFILLFLSTSVNCYTVTVNSILGLYENFAEVTLDIGRSSQTRTDWYAYAVMYSLPYCAQLLASHDSNALNDILGTFDVYMAKRQKSHVSLLRVWDSDDPHPQEDYLDCLWAQIHSLRSAGWQEKVIWRLYDSFPSLKEAGQPHHLSPLTPPDYDPEVSYPLPRVVFRMFDYTDVIEQDEEEVPADSENANRPQTRSKEPPVLPGAHTIERFLIDEQLAILMCNLNFNRTLCAKAMLGLKTRARVALDYMIIESVFAGMFSLPNPPVQHGNLLFYGSLLIQLCQEASNSMPLVLAQATEVLYERLDIMKPVAIGRLIEWFSYHLSNYQLQWSWRGWSGAIDEEHMSPHRRMITETLARLMRFSYYDNVKRLLPKSFYPLLPPEPVVVNKYSGRPDIPTSTLFFQLIEAIRNRLGAAEVLKLAQRSAKFDPSASPGSQDELEVENDVDNDATEEKDGAEFESSEDDQTGSPHSDVQSPKETDSAVRRRKRPHLVARRRMLHPSQKQNSVLEGQEDEVMNPAVSVADQMKELSHGVTNFSVELFFSALFIAGHKTISHTFSVIKKYSGVIRSIASSVDSQVEALHVLQAVWANHPQMIVIITEHMCRTSLIDPEAIVRWAYSPVMTSLTEIPMGYNPSGARPRILDFYVWECLNRTLTRVGRRVTRITSRLESAKELFEKDGRRSDSSSPERRGNMDDNDDDYRDDDNERRRGGSRRKRFEDGRRKLIAGCELVSSDEENNLILKGPMGSRIARLEEARCEAVRSQCAVITLLLHRHARLTSEVAAELAGDDLGLSRSSTTMLLHSSGTQLGLSNQTLHHIAFWLKGRLVQVVLEHFDQLMPYLDNLDEFICGAHPEIQDVFQQLRSLHA